MATKTRNDDKVFSEEERAAVAATARERKGSAGRSPEQERADGLTDLQEAIAKMPADDRAMAERIHAIVTETAPDLVPKTWYGQPAYAKDGKVVVFFQAASKFKTRYATLGFNEDANLDDGSMWPTAFALVSLTAADEKRIAELVERAVG